MTNFFGTAILPVFLFASQQNFVTRGVSYTDPLYSNIGDGCLIREKAVIEMFENKSIQAGKEANYIPLGAASAPHALLADQGIVEISISNVLGRAYEASIELQTGLTFYAGSKYQTLFTEAFVKCQTNLTAKWSQSVTATQSIKNEEKYTLDLSHPEQRGVYSWVWVTPKAYLVGVRHYVVQEKNYRHYGSYGSYREDASTLRDDLSELHALPLDNGNSVSLSFLKFPDLESYTRYMNWEAYL